LTKKNVRLATASKTGIASNNLLKNILITESYSLSK
jgi:hypothetical protein